MANSSYMMDEIIFGDIPNCAGYLSIRVDTRASINIAVVTPQLTRYVSSIGSSSRYGSHTDIEVMAEEAYFKQLGTDCMDLIFAMTHVDRMHMIHRAESSAIGAMLRSLRK